MLVYSHHNTNKGNITLGPTSSPHVLFPLLSPILDFGGKTLRDLQLYCFKIAVEDV